VRQVASGETLIRHSTALSYLTPQAWTKASKAASASFLVSAIPDVLQRPLGFRLLAVRQFVEDVGGFVHPAALAARLRPYLFDRLPESERTIGDRELGTNRQPTPLEIEEQFAPRLRTLAHPVGEADKLLPALGCGSDDDQQALRGIFETGLHVNAVDPEVDVGRRRQHRSRKSFSQWWRSQIAHAPEPALWSEHKERELVPVTRAGSLCANSGRSLSPPRACRLRWRPAWLGSSARR
jgi:hypothetical protein